MINSIKIKQNSERSKNGARQQHRDILFVLDPERLAGSPQNESRKEKSNQVAKKAFLYGGQIAGKPDKQVHKRKEKCGHEQKCNAFFTVVYHSKIPLLGVLG